MYRAIVPESGRLVALKLLNPSEPLLEFVGEKNLRDIFSAEAFALSRLKHPNITRVLDLDYYNGRPFYTMEYFCNNLGSMIGEKYIVEENSRLIPTEKAIEYGSQILSGLQCMHDEGIIHRDIKPFNILVATDDTIKICDLGMARLKEEESFIPEGMNIGSPYYASPEQVSDPENADNRSDLYSVGVLLYRMITGELPAMKNFMLSHVNPLFDNTWDTFFSKALSWKPDLRFQNAQEMKESLTKLELHWEKNKAKSCRTVVKKSGQDNIITLRTIPERASGVKARKLFDVDNLWQPNVIIDNRFTSINNETVLDEATKLLWQRTPSDYPLDRQSADDFIHTLNEIRYKGINTWRLPTVNELLSLVADPVMPVRDCKETLLNIDIDWFWSCDRRSPETSWHVNTKLGYTDWQNNNCQYTVRAVTTMN